MSNTARATRNKPWMDFFNILPGINNPMTRRSTGSPSRVPAAYGRAMLVGYMITQ